MPSGDACVDRETLRDFGVRGEGPGAPTRRRDAPCPGSRPPCPAPDPVVSAAASPPGRRAGSRARGGPRAHRGSVPERDVTRDRPRQRRPARAHAATRVGHRPAVDAGHARARGRARSAPAPRPPVLARDRRRGRRRRDGARQGRRLRDRRLVDRRRRRGGHPDRAGAFGGAARRRGARPGRHRSHVRPDPRQVGRRRPRVLRGRALLRRPPPGAAGGPLPADTHGRRPDAGRPEPRDAGRRRRGAVRHPLERRSHHRRRGAAQRVRAPAPLRPPVRVAAAAHRGRAAGLVPALAAHRRRARQGGPALRARRAAARLVPRPARGPARRASGHRPSPRRGRPRQPGGGDGRRVRHLRLHRLARGPGPASRWAT